MYMSVLLVYMSVYHVHSCGHQTVALDPWN